MLDCFIYPSLHPIDVALWLHYGERAEDARIRFDSLADASRSGRVGACRTSICGVAMQHALAMTRVRTLALFADWPVAGWLVCVALGGWLQVPRQSRPTAKTLDGAGVG